MAAFAAVLLATAGVPAIQAKDSPVAAQSRQAFEARGLLRAIARTDIGTVLRARAKEVPFRVGERFEKGDSLIVFDCERYHAEENAAKASADAAWIDYTAKKRLLKYGAAGKDEVSLAGAIANKASAELSVNEAVSSECIISAPFDGRIASLNIAPHEYPSAEAPMISILDDSALEIELVVPSMWLRWLKPGSAFSFTVEETGKTIHSEVGRIGAEVDPVSQTVVIYAGVTGADESVLAGMSGTANFSGGS